LFIGQGAKPGGLEASRGPRSRVGWSVRPFQSAHRSQRESVEIAKALRPVHRRTPALWAEKGKE
jgi:hypothetical protein